MKKNLLLAFFIIQAFLATAQRFEWLSHSNQSSFNGTSPVAIDPSGNILTLIWTDGSGTIIGNDTFPCLTAANGIVIAKYSPAGTLLWGKMVNPDGGVIYAEKIAVDNAGAVYISFQFPNGGNVHMNDTVFLPTPVAEGAVIVKLDSSGNFVRSVSFNHSAAPRIACLGTDLFISYQSTIAKLDSAFNTVWSISGPAGQVEFVTNSFARNDLFVQSNGELIASACELFNSNGPLPFGNDSIYFSAGGFNETAVLKLDTSGHVLWTKALSLNASGQPSVSAVCIDHFGNSYLGAGGINAQNIFANDTLVNSVGIGEYLAVLKWDTAGVPIHAFGIYPVANTPSIYDLAVNAQSEILVSGFSGGGGVYLNGNTLFNAFNNFFIAKYDSAGALAWHKSANNSSSSDGIAVRNGNEYVVAGVTWNGGIFRFGCLSYSTNTATNFVTLLSEQPERNPVASFTFAVNNDTTFTFSDLSTDATSWHWDFGNGDSSNAQNPVHSFSLGSNVTIILTVRNGACTSTDTLVIVSVGIPEINTTLALDIYPNPSAGTFILRMSDRITVQQLKIVNMLGEEISFKFEDADSNTSETTVVLKNTTPGIYLMIVRKGERLFSHKFMIR